MLELTPHIAQKLARTAIIVIGGSAGCFNILGDMLQAMPASLSIAVLVVIHRNAKYESHYEELLNKKCRVAVKAAEDKEAIQPGTAYFAPPGYHLLVEPDHKLSLDISEPVHFCRPAIDVTLQSTVDVYGPSTAAVLLSGANQDGAEGMHAVYQKNGLCVVQHPHDAEFDSMPAAAIASGASHLTLTDIELITFFSTMLKSHTFRN